MKIKKQKNSANGKSTMKIVSSQLRVFFESFKEFVP